MEQWLAIETRACAAWSKAFQWLAGASVVVLQQQTLKLSGHSNTVVAAVEAPLSTMRIVFKILVAATNHQVWLSKMTKFVWLFGPRYK
jgi:hypothetical protein